MLFCVFCGLRALSSHKLLPRSYVVELLQKQSAAGVSDPVSDVMRAHLVETAQDASQVTEAAAGIESASEAPQQQLLSCMCCYYWVERRSTLSVAPLPMQKLLWFVRTLCWCESVCDSRVLQRLVLTVVEPDNVFAVVFDESELEGLRLIARELHGARLRARQTPRMQGDTHFCIKRAIAKLWRAENANCLCLPHASAADWLR
jgi:hypothetical protein